MKRINYFFLMVLMCLSAVNAWAQTEPFRTTVYDMNYDGSKYYRIPALATAGDGSLVAIADKRGNQLGDLPNDISVVCRRSEDQGVTWSKPVVIAQGMGEGQGYGDPCVIYDRDKDKLVCIFAGKQGLWLSTNYDPITINYSESTDNGVSWSAPQDITRQIYKSNWYGSFAGSGHGLQLKNGRLMFVVATRHDSKQPWQGAELTNYAVFSDDHGATWQISSPVSGAGDEAKVVELENGDILMSIRNPKKGYRKFAVSHDLGMNWDEPYLNFDLKDPACDGDIIRYDYKGQSLLLQSLPNSTSIREKVTIYASFDEGKTWKVKKQISDNYSAYSSMTVLPDGQICMLVEDGKFDSGLPGEDGFRLNFVRFGLDWLTGQSGEEEEFLKGTLNLNGDGRYMRIPNDAALFPEKGGQYTITCKVKLPAFKSGSNMRFVATRGYEGTSNSAISGYELFGGNSASQAFSVNASLVGKPWGAGHAWATESYAAGEWAHLAWTFDGASQTSTIYVNGRNAGVKKLAEFADHAWYNKLDVLVGAGYTQVDGSPCVPSWFTTGEIDDVRFYKKTLTADEVVADKELVTVGATTPNLVAAYDFTEINGLEVKDISGNGHNGILEGFPNVAKKCVVTITTPDSKEGSLRVWNGTSEVASGMKLSAGTKLTIEATPTEKYKLTGIYANDVKVEGTELTLENDVTLSATFEKKDPNALDYAIPSETDNQRTFNNSPNRLIHSITINGATMNGAEAPFTYNLNNQNGQKEVYIDATTETVNVTTGDNLNIVFDDEIIWLHYYVYIDYNHDGVFDPKTELVSYSYLNGQNSEGRRVNNGPDSTLPGFQIKPDATPVKTRMRIKTDWDSDSPTGNPTQSIGGNGGTIVDFNIDIHAMQTITYPLHINQVNGGVVTVTNAEGVELQDGDEVAAGTELTLQATPKDGYKFVHFLVNNQPYESDMIVMDEELAISAKFTNGVQINFNQPEGCVVTFADAMGNPVNSGDYVEKGGDMLLFVNLEEGYELTSIKVNEEEKIDAMVAGSMLMLNKVMEDLNIVLTTQKKITGIGQVEGNQHVAYQAAEQTLVLPEGATAQVYNAAGQLVLNVKGGIVSVAALQDGCYVVRVATEAGVQTLKFIKK